MIDDSRDIYLVRHGHLQKDRDRCYVGQKDFPLSDLGIAQAEALREFFSQITFTQIVTSDLKQTLTTANIIAQNQTAQVKTRPAFREVNLGLWEGLGFDEVMTRYPDEYHRRGVDIAGQRPPQGENFQDLTDRVLPAFHQATSGIDGPQLIVTHIGVIRVILCHILSIPLNNLFLLHHDYGSFSKVGKTGDRHTLICYNSRGCDMRFNGMVE